MEKNTAPRARFVAAILLFVAVIAGDLVLSRDYLTQGLYAIPAFLIFELVMLFLLVVGIFLFCNRRGLDSNKKLLLGFGFFAAEIGKVGFRLGHGITLLIIMN